jgi:hypothetical protein
VEVKRLENKIELVHVAGPFGDETSQYEVNFPENITVEEFINIAVSQYPKWWGDFEVPDHKHNVAKYSYGDITILDETLYETVKDKKVSAVTAYGGWTLMTYNINTVPLATKKIVNHEKISGIFPF